MIKQKNIDRLKFYYIDENYANFLRSKYDKRVPNTKGENYKYDKFFIGVVLRVNNWEYFAPVSSYKQDNALTFNIKDTDGDFIASVRPNYMFPVVKGVCKPVVIKSFKGFYKYLLQEELRYCNKHRGEICDMANKIYSKKTIYNYSSSEERKMYDAMCCNFKWLEHGAKAFLDKDSANLSAEEKALIEKYPIDAAKLLQIKRVQESIINKDGRKVTLENCVRANIKFAPEIYGREWSDKITREDRQMKKQKAQEKMTHKTNASQPKTQEKIVTKNAVRSPKNFSKKRPYNSK
jgi:protein AbiQ